FDAAGSTISDVWYTAAEVCPYTWSCLVASSTALTPGFYSWRVRSRSTAGEGPWSEYQSFKAALSYHYLSDPDLPPNSQPEYIWSPVDGAEAYQLQVAGSGGSFVVDAWYDAGDVCAGGVCTLTSPTVLVPDHYLWQVRIRAGGIEGPWSRVTGFRVGASTAIEPNWRWSSLPEYLWAPVSGATEYELKVLDEAGNVLIDTWHEVGSVCGQEECTVTPSTALALDQRYSWRVRTRFDGIDGPWSNTEAFSVALPPDIPVLVSPQGDGIDYDPAYIWNEVDNANYYDVKVYDVQSGNLVASDQWLYAGDICNSGTCQVTFLPLERGDYRWRVRAVGDAVGSWSADMSFHVGPLPGMVTPLSPQGDVTETQPTFAWQELPSMVGYQVQILDAQETIAADEWVDAAVCTDGTCEATSSVTLAGGDYHWQVRAENIDGPGPWSDAMSFTVWTIPGSVTPISPQGDGIDWYPTYTWSAASQASSYQVQVFDAQDAIVVDESIEAIYYCADGMCQATIWIWLDRGDYYWQVRAQNPSGPGPWSAQMSFTVGPLPGIVTPSSPQGDGIDVQPTYYWQGDYDATEYRLQVTDALDTIVLDELFDASGNCDYEVGVYCWATPSTALELGGYHWQVRGENIDGPGPWSNELSFTVGLLPGEVILISPEGADIDTQPTYIWDEVVDATQYQVMVTDALDVVVVDELVDAANVCTDGTCSTTPSVTLERGSYRWQVRARNASGNGPWSTEMSFIVGPLAGIVVPISPQGDGIEAQPTYTWNEVADTTQYQVQVTDSQDVVIVDEWVDAAGECSGGICQAMPATTLVRGGYQWSVRASNASGPGPWSTGMGFVIGLLPASTTLISPQGDDIDVQPAYTWNEVADTTRYQLRVADAQEAIMVDIWVEAAGVCTGGTCSTMPSTTLDRGGYHWSVRTENASGLGAWSDEMDFVVGKLPAKPVLVSPEGIDTTLPIYQWDEAAEAAVYRLVAHSDEGQTVTDRSYLAEDICQDDVCQTQAARLAEGSYHWQVIASNPSGDGPWSDEMDFVAVELATSRGYDWHYEYDNLNRLTYACAIWDDVALACNGNELYYEYDGAGNLTRFDKWDGNTEQVETVRYSINGANQIACLDDSSADGECDDGETLWEYDAYGNLLSDGTTTYTYDAANRVASITAASVTTTYTYNGDGDRIAQETGGVETTYVIDIATSLTMVLSETTAGETTQYWHGLDILAQSDSLDMEYFTYDGLGSVRQLVDEGGTVELGQTFDPYGNGYATSGSASSRFGWTGEQIDGNGFVYLRARYYQPGMGRFTQMDPSGQEKNPYLYAASNPILSIDPSGLYARSIYALLNFANCSTDIPLASGSLIPALGGWGNKKGPFPLPSGWDYVKNPAKAMQGIGDDRAIHPNDVDQEDLTDCYFAAAIAEIALRRPDIINRNIWDNRDGTFAVTFHLHGYTSMRIKPMYPLHTDGKIYHLLPGDYGLENWPLILENAWAALKSGNWDVKRGYAVISGGGIPEGEVFEALTGKPSSVIYPEDLTFEKIGGLFEQGNLITLSSLGHSKTAGIKEYADTTLYPWHSYPVEKIDRANRQIILRNVWNWDAFGEIGIDGDRLSTLFGLATVNSG
ncbi:MAG: hypothetical protein JXB30_02465, partial [Anaerolineae bacterium]|nr:hypothetical protein [Anaerolineae bacterium]